MDPLSIMAVGSLGVSGLGNIMGGFQQAKAAKKQLDFQKQQYRDWNNARLQDQSNLEAGFSDHFTAQGRRKGSGLLGLESQGLM